MIPCKENGCLKYPICQSRVTIFCTLLYNYMYENNDNWLDGFESLKNLIDLYRDKYEGQPYMDKIRDGAPIINSTRLMDKVEKDNII